MDFLVIDPKQYVLWLLLAMPAAHYIVAFYASVLRDSLEQANRYFRRGRVSEYSGTCVRDEPRSHAVVSDDEFLAASHAAAVLMEGFGTMSDDQKARSIGRITFHLLDLVKGQKKAKP